MKTLIVILAVVGVCICKPFSQKVYVPGAGQYFITRDHSFEKGVLETDYSIEFIPGTYNRGSKALAKSANAQSGYGYWPYHSSEELYYHLAQQGTKGMPHNVRVKALRDQLNHRILDISDARLLGYDLHNDGQFVYDHSGEIHFQPNRPLGGSTGTGVVAHKK